MKLKDYICFQRENWGDRRELISWQLALRQQGRHWYFFPSKSRKNKLLLGNLYVLDIKRILLYFALKISFHRRPMKKSMTKYSCASSLQKMGHLCIYHFSLCALRLSCPISCPSNWVFCVYCSNTSLKQQQYLFYGRPHVNDFQHIFKHRVLPMNTINKQEKTLVY